MSRFNLAGWGFIASIFLLLWANPVLAGGGPVYIDLGSTLSSWNNPSSPRQIVAKVHLHPDVPCAGTKITFKYEEQKDGDDVSTGSSGPSLVIQEVGARWLNGKSVYDCGTYAKYTSKNKELKYGIILVTTPQGQTHERKVALNFQSDEPIQSSGDNLPWDNEVAVSPTTATEQPSNTPNPSSNINAWVLNQQLHGSDNRYVTIKWAAFDGNPGTFTIYGRLTSNKNNWDKLLEEQRGPSAVVTLKANEDYYIRVSGCQHKVGTCADSNIILIPKVQKTDGEVVFPSLGITTPPSTENTKVDELNNKVADLEKKLEESKQKQSFLEQRVTDLANFIKRLFPFFK